MEKFDIIDFYNHEALDLPKSRNLDLFKDDVEDIFNLYLNKLELLMQNLEAGNSLGAYINDFEKLFTREVYQIVDKLCKGLIAVLKLNVEDNNVEASYLKFIDLINDAQVQIYFDQLISKDNVSGYVKNLYRIRRKSDDKPINEVKHMFHIPFEASKEREYGMYRFSYKNTPCLYLAGSVDLCFKELCATDVDEIHISRFDASDDKQIKVLNLAYRPAYNGSFFQEVLNNNPDAINSYNKLYLDILFAQTVCFPLLACCLIKVKDSKADVKQEYIFPQLLMRWVTDVTNNKNRCDGIRYFSSKLDSYTIGSPKPYCNFAFPVKTQQTSGYCPELSSMFVGTEPKLYVDLTSSNAINHKEVQKSLDLLPAFKI